MLLRVIEIGIETGTEHVSSFCRVNWYGIGMVMRSPPENCISYFCKLQTSPALLKRQKYEKFH